MENLEKMNLDKYQNNVLTDQQYIEHHKADLNQTA
jgi:hypothetical protein